MHYSTTFLIAALSSIGTSKPLSSRAIAQFPAGTPFDIVLNGSKYNVTDYQNSPVNVIDIDLEDNYENGDLNTISELAKTKTVICYFSAGSREKWRADAGDFLRSDYGQNMTDWPGENWLDLKSENVKKIMTKRIQMAKNASCHAIDPDNIDGFVNNQDGYGYDQSVYIDYVKWLAKTAADLDLAVGLKNGIEIIPNVTDVVQFAVNEQCHAIKVNDSKGVIDTECMYYKPFTQANKAVFNIEYGLHNCTDPVGVNLSTVVKDADQKSGLDTLGGQC